MQYYCDYCKKNGGSRHHMERHEKACTANPKRVCRVCGQKGISDDVRKFLSGVDVLKTYEDSAYRDQVLSDFREVTEYCPACMLAAVRQIPGAAVEFDYQEEHKSYWKERHQDEGQY